MTAAATAQPQRVLWVFTRFEGLAARRFAALAPRLAPDYEHVALTLDGAAGAIDQSAEGLLGARLRVLQSPAKARRGVSVGGLWSARKTLAAERPALIVSHGPGALDLLAVNRGPGSVPQIHLEDAEGPSETLDTDDAALGWARRRAFPGRGRAFVAATRELEALMVETWGAPRGVTHRLPMGADLARFAADARRRAAEASGPSGPLTLGVVAPLVAERRHDRLLRLVASLRERGRDVRALIVGEGPARGAIETDLEVLRLGDAVVIEAPAATLERQLARIDLYVSTADRDRSGDALAGAMAAGLPIVATDVGDLRATVSEPNRLFVRSASDESALVAAAELACADAGLRRTLGVANRAAAEATLSLEAMARRFEELMRALIGSPTRLMLPSPSAFADEGRGAPESKIERALGALTGPRPRSYDFGAASAA